MSLDFNLTKIIENFDEKAKNGEIPLKREFETFDEDDEEFYEGSNEIIKDITDDYSEIYSPRKISFIPFYDWLLKNISKMNELSSNKFENIKIDGIDSKDTLLFTIPLNKKKREICILKNCSKYKVFDNLDIKAFSVFPNGTFLIHYIIDDKYSVKFYGLKNSPIIFDCIKIGEYDIPYHDSKLSKLDNFYKFVFKIDHGFERILNMKINKEALKLLYKQSSKQIDSINTYENLFKWLKDRYDYFFDINHLIQIDLVLKGITSERLEKII